jgi:hypothetical protein
VDVPNVLSTDMNRAFAVGSSLGFIPPDPHVAVGKETLLVTVNSLISIYDKKTMERIVGPIDGLKFFPGFVGTEIAFGDTHSIYDVFNERIWITGYSLPIGVNARFNLCVSKNASPRTGSDFYCYKQDFPSDPFSDYPKVAVDATNVYIGFTNLIDLVPPAAYQHVAYVFEKAALMDGTAPYIMVPTSVDMSPYTLRSTGKQQVAEFPWPAVCPFKRPSDKLKQVIFATIGDDRDDNSIPASATDERITVKYIKDPLGTPVVISVEVPVPHFISTRLFGAQPAPLIPSLTNQTLTGIDIITPLFSPVVANDMLYVAHVLMNGNRTVIRWYQIDVSKLVSHDEATLIQFGTIDDGISTFSYPAISVDKHDNVAFGFNIQSPFQYIKPAYTVRMKNDPIGTVRFPLRDLAPGDHYYQANGGGRNRYGDYSGLAVDPIDGETFWIFNQYTYRVPQTTRYTFGTAWNTKLGAFNPEKSGGHILNAPQTEHFFGGTAADIPSTRRRRHENPVVVRLPKMDVPQKRMTAEERVNQFIQHHIPNGEGCYRQEGRIICPHLDGE